MSVLCLLADWAPVARALLSFISRPKDVKNAKFYAESNGCVGGFWNGLNGVSISAILVFLYLIVYCPALMPRRTLSPNQYGSSLLILSAPMLVGTTGYWEYDSSRKALRCKILWEMFFPFLSSLMWDLCEIYARFMQDLCKMYQRAQLGSIPKKIEVATKKIKVLK